MFATLVCITALLLSTDPERGRQGTMPPCQAPEAFQQQLRRRPSPSQAQPRSFEVLGPYSNYLGQGNQRDSVRTNSLPWSRLAEAHIRGFKAAAPLPAALRLRAAAAYRRRNADPELGPPVLRFSAAAGDARRGPYFLVDAEEASSAKIQRVQGGVILDVDADGCELAERVYEGTLEVARLGPRKKLGGFLVRSRGGPISFRYEHVDAHLVGKGEVELAIPGMPRPWRTRSPQALTFSVALNGSGALDGESLTGATLFTVEPTGERFLLVHSSMQANCETQLALYLLGDKGPELVQRAALDCDV